MFYFGFLKHRWGNGGGPGPSEAVIVTAQTSASGNHIIIDFDTDITGTTNIHDFTVKVDGMVDNITMANMLLPSRIELTLATPIINTDINIAVSHYGGGDTNMAIFLDYTVTNVVPVVIQNLPSGLIQVIDGRTAIHGAHIALEFDGAITGVVTHEEFTLVADSSPRSLTGVNILNNSIELTLSPPIESGNNVYLYYENDGNNNIDSFVDLIINNTVPAPAPASAPDLDLDGDDLPDTVIYQNGDVTITEDEDSYNVDLDGDGVEDIHVEK